ncbi:MAG: NUDIX domain-containing protein [Bacilli bacterium]|nr:NUDIX domain-containing protein [Bacilli bacterium]
MRRDFCASAFVVDPSTKKILLVKHKDYNRWLQPGGHVIGDEVPEETAERETYEETGIRIKLIGERFPRESDFIRPLGIQRNYRDDITHVDIIYAAVPYDETLLTVDHNESYTAGWFSREDLDHMEVFPDVKITMDYILENMIH